MARQGNPHPFWRSSSVEELYSTLGYRSYGRPIDSGYWFNAKLNQYPAGEGVNRGKKYVQSHR